jgi:hypothetical protein
LTVFAIVIDFSNDSINAYYCTSYIFFYKLAIINRTTGAFYLKYHITVRKKNKDWPLDGKSLTIDSFIHLPFAI